MPKEVWKYSLLIGGSTDIAMPDGAGILTVGNQNEECVIWALVDPSRAATVRTFAVVGAGFRLGDGFTREGYIGTIMTRGGALVWHTFEIAR